MIILNPTELHRCTIADDEVFERISLHINENIIEANKSALANLVSNLRILVDGTDIASYLYQNEKSTLKSSLLASIPLFGK